MKEFQIQDTNGNTVGLVKLDDILVETINELGCDFTFSVERSPLGLRGFTFLFTPMIPALRKKS